MGERRLCEKKCWDKLFFEPVILLLMMQCGLSDNFFIHLLFCVTSRAFYRGAQLRGSSLRNPRFLWVEAIQIAVMISDSSQKNAPRNDVIQRSVKDPGPRDEKRAG